MVTEATMAPSIPGQDWMTPEEFRSWFVRLGLSQSELGRRLDVKQPTISRWLETDPEKQRKIEHGSMLRLALERLETVLEDERNPKRRRRNARPDVPTEGA
jgi:transcriptional regulator with XRE-family HTH domain